MRYYLIAIVLIIAYARCASARPNVVPPVVQQAVKAETSGLGGCLSTLEIENAPTIVYWPALHFFDGHCTAEHGADQRVRVGIDDDGIVFLLDSPSSFRFLLQRHKPSNLDSASVLEYGIEALRMRGDISRMADVLRVQGDLPDSLRNVGAFRTSMRMSTVVASSDLGWELSIYTMDEVGLSRWEVTVLRSTGDVLTLEHPM